MSKCKYCECKKGESASKFLAIEKANLGWFGKDYVCAYIYDDKFLGMSVGSGSIKVKINFCPMCGREL